MLTKEDLEERYGSDWELETLDRVMVLGNPEAEKLWDIIEDLINTRDGIRAENDFDWFKSPRELSHDEERTLIKTIDRLMILLDRLES